MAEPTYIFKDGHVYTMVDGQVVSSVKEADFSWGDMARSESEPPAGVTVPEAPEEVCPNCGYAGQVGDNYCPNCGEAMASAEDPNVPSFEEAAQSGEFGPEGGGPTLAKQVVTTPNGLQGRVLARVPSLWGEEVTVRFENGVIKKIPVDQRLTFANAEETPAEKSAAQSLEERLGAHFEQDKMSLVERGRELQAIEREAGAKVAGASDSEAVELSKIATQARYELAEITAALEAINAGEQEAYEAPAPIRNLPQVTQASTNGVDASWLEQVEAKMVSEANSTDYKKLMDEGPEAFVASLDSSQLADAATTRIMAAREIDAKTAGADESQKDAYRRMWLARVEQQRQAALTSHKEKVAEKTAATEERSVPDESLFLS